MPELKGLSKLKGILDKLMEAAEQTRVNLEEKREWVDEKSDKWQESEIGEEWTNHLDETENLLDEIESIDYEFLQ